ALFAVIEGQDYALVNYHIKGDYMVAQRLLDVAVLKLGKAEVRVTKYKSRTGLFGTSIGSGEGG
ncbi:MAG: TrbG/VirB9 family P-type conjugative transfer protein, partial [Polaromonas sp.]|nr:TrbG/VirB9 family P-type conjugative transfer protein [Polaromonas sp.]